VVRRRRDDRDRFYALLADLADRGGTHAVSAGSSTSLWDRLKQHYGTGSESSAHPHGGNHRGSVSSERVGEAFIERHALHDDDPDYSGVGSGTAYGCPQP